MAASELFRPALIMIFIIYKSGIISPISSCGFTGNDELKKSCKQQSTYFLTDQQSLRVDLYYDANVKPDGIFILSMCKARKHFKHVTFSFFVGIGIQRNENGKLECPNSDRDDKDCSYALLDACASQLLPDFAAYVCCSYDPSEKPSTIQECYQSQKDNVDEFMNCGNLQDPRIKPDEILLENSKKAIAAFPKEKDCWPFLAFHGQIDSCARLIFYNHPAKVICAMLVNDVEEECD